MTYATLSIGTIFQFANDRKNGVDTVYEKVGPAHYRRGVRQIGYVCIPIRMMELGEQEPVLVVQPPIVTIPGH